MKHNRPPMRLLVFPLILLLIASSACRLSPLATAALTATALPPTDTAAPPTETATELPSPTPEPSLTPTPVTPTATPPGPAPQLDAGFSAFLTGQADFPAMAASQNGERLVLIGSAAPGQMPVNGAILFLPDNQALVVLLGPDGRPEKAAFGNKWIQFSNYTESSVDLTLFYPDGSQQKYFKMNVDPAILIQLIPLAEGTLTLWDAVRSGAFASGMAGCVAGFALEAKITDPTCSSALVSSLNPLLGAEISSINANLELTSANFDAIACPGASFCTEKLQDAAVKSVEAALATIGGQASSNAQGQATANLPGGQTTIEPALPSATPIINAPPTPRPARTATPRSQATPTKKSEKKPPATPTKR